MAPRSRHLASYHCRTPAGKSLQTLALIWTLLKQSPAGATSPTVGKAIIVCPSSLVNNWKAEFKKWCAQ